MKGHKAVYSSLTFKAPPINFDVNYLKALRVFLRLARMPHLILRVLLVNFELLVDEHPLEPLIHRVIAAARLVLPDIVNQLIIDPDFVRLDVDAILDLLVDRLADLLLPVVLVAEPLGLLLSEPVEAGSTASRRSSTRAGAA